MQVPTPSNQLLDLSSSCGVVTGAAKGIGRAIAQRLAEVGARLVLVDADEQPGVEAAKAIEGAGGRARFVGGDVADPKTAQRAIDACVQAYGRVDLLVNNAGIFPSQPALQITEAAWDRVLAVNLKSAFFFSQAAARRMFEQGGGGSIVQIASIDALHPSGNLAHYDASKAGMVMMTKSLALELAKSGVRVNAICPGAIATPGANDTLAAMAKGMGVASETLSAGFAAKIPMGRMGRPDEIAGAALFFASPLSSYCTGSVLVVDGGWLCA